VVTDRQSSEYVNPAAVNDPTNAAPFGYLAAEAFNLFLQLGSESGALLSVRFDDHLEATIAEILGDYLKSKFASDADSMKAVQLADKCPVACSHVYSSCNYGKTYFRGRSGASKHYPHRPGLINIPQANGHF
jgi:hypothetical protein